MAKRDKEVVVYIRMEEATREKLKTAAKEWDMDLSNYCRMVLIQSLKK